MAASWLVLAAALLAQAAPAATPVNAPTPPAAGNPAPDIVCRSEPEPGSRLTRHVCESRTAMLRRQAQDRDDVRRLQSRFRTYSDGAMGGMMGPSH